MKKISGLEEVDAARHMNTVSFDPRAFEHGIETQGIKLVHYRAMRCPVGLVELGDNRRPNDHDHNCSNGYHYTRAGTIVCLFTGNNNSMSQHDVGFLDGSSVQVTAQRYYSEVDCDGDLVAVADRLVSIAPFDRFYLLEENITVPHWQLFEASVTGEDRLDYPVVSVLDLMDSNGVSYKEGRDFDVKRGWIRWGDNRPTFDHISNKGQICSIRFEYRPFWYVTQLPHQIRFAQIDDPETGKRSVVTMPHSLVLAREYVHHNHEANKDSTPVRTSTEDRAGVAPRSGSFGPR